MNNTKININNKNYYLNDDPDTFLLEILRNKLKLKGSKFGCGLEQCGACLVIADNESLYSCTSKIKDLEGKKITTIEGLNNNGSLSLLQTTFMEERAGQCGYCIPGIIMSAELLLKKNPHPNREDIKTALSKNLCRCGAHNSILKAVEKAVNHQS